MAKIELSAEVREKLRLAEADMEEAREGIDSLRAIGVDVSKMEEEWRRTERMRTGLLEKF